MGYFGPFKIQRSFVWFSSAADALCLAALHRRTTTLPLTKNMPSVTQYFQIKTTPKAPVLI